MRGHNIIQYNCGNTNEKSARPFLDSLHAEEYPIIAIQEPMVTTRTEIRTYCPRNYRLSRPAEEGMRLVFFIHELIPLTDCEVVLVSTHCKHIRIRTQGEVINVINAYNPQARQTNTRLRDGHNWPRCSDRRRRRPSFLAILTPTTASGLERTQIGNPKPNT